MAAIKKENPYAGRVKITIDGQSAEELGEAYVAAVVTDWFIRSMYCSPSAAGNPVLQQLEYIGMDFDKFKKGEQDV